MIKKFFYLMMLLALFACSSKRMSDLYLQGERYYENYKKYYGSGDFKIAETNFLKGVDLFQKSDNICNLSSMYIGKYIIENDNKSMDIAKRYALLNNCRIEMNIIDYFMGRSYVYDILPISLKIQASEFKSAEDLIKRLSKKDVDDFSKSRLSRLFSKRFMGKGSFKDADMLSDFAIEIDRFNGWTYNLREDLLIKKAVCNSVGSDCKYIDERLGIIDAKLNKN